MFFSSVAAGIVRGVCAREQQATPLRWFGGGRFGTQPWVECGMFYIVGRGYLPPIDSAVRAFFTHGLPHRVAPTAVVDNPCLRSRGSSGRIIHLYEILRRHVR